MKELPGNTYNDKPTHERLCDVLDFDREDIGGSAVATYLRFEEIVSARETLSQRVADAWFLEREHQFLPSKAELNEGTLVFTTLAAHEGGKLLPDHENELAYFWSEVGSAIIGAEIEIETRSGSDKYPITDDVHPQKKRSDRDRFHRSFEERLSGLAHEEVVIFETPETVQLRLAAD